MELLESIAEKHATANTIVISEEEPEALSIIQDIDDY